MMKKNVFQKSSLVRSSKVPSTSLTASDYRVGTLFVNTFLFENIVTSKFGFILAVHADSTVRSDTTRAFTTWPQLVLEIAFFH